MPTAPPLAVGVLAVAVLAGCSAAPANTSRAAPSPRVTFAGFPSFLPKDTVDGSALHTVVTASSNNPALASQGDSVRVSLAGGSVLATVTGPEVPNEGLPTQAPTSPATFLLTFSQARGVVPLAASAFKAIDDEGRVYTLTAPSGSSVPATVRAGQTVSFKLFANVATGEGRLRWIPSGHLAPVEWDYVVEDD